MLAWYGLRYARRRLGPTYSALSMSTDQYFRAGVGMLIVDSAGRLLAGQRVDHAETWQPPQGGILRGEEPIDAARRELSEEFGISWSDVNVLAQHPEWLAYELPAEARSEKTGRGQVQRWFLLSFEGSPDAIEVASGPEQEFSRWIWTTTAGLLEHSWEVKQSIYRRLLSMWSSHLEPTQRAGD